MIIYQNTTFKGQAIQPTDLTLIFDIDDQAGGVVKVTIQTAQGKQAVTAFNMDPATFTKMLKVLSDAVVQLSP